MAASTKEQRGEKEKRVADAPREPAVSIAPGAVEQLTAASRDALRAGDQAGHAALESALFALYTARTRLAAIDLDGAVGAVKALL
ncbi:hypothetical protein [Paraburkholderia sp. SOS3]|uniref:hypothetical protein n=1 Tax=Paraburkholderia sp. SOS3 TaxID=1926494 RepID=UPI0009475169|nr:hypothetical protein [Paraburkholderia sp. SOS3]APR40022.1 hypothetical protein BTO02_33315 [Paraburkholderia sp. SOS3]